MIPPADGRPAPPAGVRLIRAPLGLTPSITEVVRAIESGRHPFLLAGRWGLPEGAASQARAVVAGVEPSRVVAAAPGEDPFAALDALPALLGDAPPGAIGGGLVGWLGYGLGRSVEPTLGPPPPRPEALPPLHLGWYDDVLRRDEEGRWWVEALVPRRGVGRRGDDAASLVGSDTAGPADEAGDDEILATLLQRWQRDLTGTGTEAASPAATPSRLGPMSVRGGAPSHLAAVAETVERIHAGELFQANVCLRLEGALHGAAAGLVAPVLEATDPWYGGWIDAGAGRAIVSASPELFLRRRGRAVETGPIKGTAPREAPALDPEADPAARALAASAKDRAEHVMIVDLMRNDLGRVSDYGSIAPEPEPRVEPHAGVWHLVSRVGGQLHEGLGDRALLRATFPPGSVTGAPKVQAMRVISAVEGTGREIYTGAHGLISPASGLELAVTIRTLELAGDRAWVGAGGGIVADSDPGRELLEALGKATALVQAAGGAVEAGGDPAEDGDGAVERDGGHDDAVPVLDAGAGAVRTPRRWMASADRRPDPARGLLETLRVEDGRPLRARGHLARLDASLRALGFPPAPTDLPADLEALAATATAPGRLRVLATRDAAAPDRLAVELQLIPVLATGVGTGPVALAPAVVPGGIGPHKYLDRDLIDALTTRLGATPLLLDADGTVLEAGWANAWWIDDDGALVTPPLDGRILPGVTRGVLLSRRDQAPVAIREASAPLDDLTTRPVLLTSSRGVSVGRLATTPPAALERATALAAALAPIVAG